MNLNNRERTLLKKLSTVGFTGNWYNAFGKHWLKIYKTDNEDRNSINVIVKFTELEVSTDFPGVIFLSDENKSIFNSFEPALQAVRQIFIS